MEDKKLEKKEILEDEAIELTQEALEQVSGGEDPFVNAPRVPEQPIDPALRENG